MDDQNTIVISDQPQVVISVPEETSVEVSIQDQPQVSLEIPEETDINVEIGESIKVVNDYEKLTNLPQVNGVTLKGNKTSSDLGLQDELVSGTNIKTINNQSILGSGDLHIESGVASVNGRTGAVVLDKNDVNLNNVDNVKQYSETNPPPYPVTSVAGKTGDVELEPADVGADPEGSAYLVQVNLDAHTNATNPHNITKATVGLGNVDNTSDANKPISTATQTALNAKQETLVSGQNIKTVGGQSILGSGDIQITTEPLDTQVKLSADLKTYYNIGKIQTASGTNPVLVGHAGDTLRQVFNNLMSMDEVQPTITAQPSISAFSLSSSASDEYGTTINSVNYSISTNQGSYTYQPSPTGVSWSKFTLSGGCASIDKTTTSGSVTLSTPFVVGTSSAVAFNCVGTHSAGGVAKTNLGNDSNPIIQIEAGTKSRTANFNKSSVLYPYYMLSNSESITTVGSSGRTKSTQNACTSAGVSLTAATNQYVYFLLPANYTQKKIQYEALGQWYDWSAGTAAVQTITITLDSGATKADYKAYRTNSKMAVGITKFRIVNQ